MRTCENGVMRDMTVEEIDEYKQSYENSRFLSIQGKIEELKQKISSKDYYFIKTVEADVLGNPRPYSQEFLKEQGEIRQGYRDQINALEAELNAQNG